MLKLPQVAVYHAEINVRRDGERGEEIVTLLVDWPEWALDREIIGGLARSTGARTMGDLAGLFEREGRVRVSPARGFYLRGDREIYDAGERIGAN